MPAARRSASWRTSISAPPFRAWSRSSTTASTCPFFRELVTGLDVDYMQDGYVTVPDAPGLGVDINEEVIRRQLREGAAYFDDTSEWNRNRVGPEWAPHDD